MTTMSDHGLVPRSEATIKQPWITPVDRKLADLPPGKYYKLSEVKEILGVSEAWMRRRLKNPNLKAPSMVMPMGESAGVYLYTQEDIEELRRYKDAGVRAR
jgi:hypothetical protein